MRLNPFQRLTAAILAIWMPLSCCCQAMALASTAVAAVAEAGDGGACGAPSCCSGHDAEDHGAAERGPGFGGDRSPPPCDECPACAMAKGKAPPPTPPTIDHDDVGHDVAWMPALDASAPACASTASPSTRDWCGAEPPWRPAGRLALAKHARLVI